MPKILSALIALLMLSPVVALASPKASVGMMNPSTSQFSYSHGLVNARFHSVPLRKALQLIANRTGVSFRVDRKVTGSVTADLDGVTLEEAVLQILRPYNRAFVFDKKHGKVQLSSVSILRKGSKDILTARYDRIGGSDHVRPARKKGLGASVLVSRSGGARASSGIASQAGAGTAAGYGGLMHEIEQTHESISMLSHKMGAENRHFQKQEAILKGQLALASDAAKPQVIKQLKALQSQSIRAKQSDVQMMMNEQQNLQQLMALQAVYQSPAQQKQQWVARQNRQHMMVSSGFSGHGWGR